ncbi:hypothetical protein GGP62_002188 [Salinibacter ruber]|uniref:hypothetical protein n=1 Tax=Salinibacter ruber TaxID=146919 RepID=UPI00216A15A6|nr:hypothetical protein [Salinibacter ruber]MCS3707201.1 hypothetical protein [Salinibacter ruber]
MTDFLLYLVARLVLAIFALVCVDTMTGTALAAEPSSILAATGLLLIADIIVYTNQQ